MNPLERAISSRRAPTLYLGIKKESVTKSPCCQYARPYCNFWFSWPNFEIYATGEHHKFMLLYFLTISKGAAVLRICGTEATSGPFGCHEMMHGNGTCRRMQRLTGWCFCNTQNGGRTRFYLYLSFW